MNEIKNVVNGNADLMGDLSQLNTENKENIVEAINEIKQREILTIGLPDDISITSNGKYYNEEFNLSKKTFQCGQKLKHQNGKIVIPTGVSKVLVSASCITNASANNNAWGIRIEKNDTEVATSFQNGAAGSFYATSISPIGIEVKEDDFISLVFYINDESKTKQIKAYSGHGTYLTVDVVE